ncbi:MAG: glycosyltransferase family 4 protein [Lachnospiraceae bacterium]|nr:glycosyltransferase family 4 protein [Lachnospiraceae bacterium]
MRILQVHNYYQIPGGEDQVVRNEGELLKEHGHEVFLYSRRNDEIKQMNLIQKICLPFTACFSLRTYRDVRKLILEKQIDIVHVHNTLPLVSPSVFYAAWSMETPIVMTVHNYRLLCPGGVFYRKENVCMECVKKGVCHSVRYACYRGSRIQTFICALSMQIHRWLKTYSRIKYICLTEFNKKQLLKLNQIPETHVFVKPNYTNYECEDVGMIEKKHGLVYAGRLEENKGIKVVLRAYRYLEKEVYANQIDCVPQIMILGDGSLRKQCEAYVDKYKLKKVVFAGLQPVEEVRKTMAKAKAVVLPTLLYEGFPMNIAESFATRTPIIGSDIGNVGDLIVDGVNGWKFPAGDYKALADIIVSLGQPDAKRCSFEMPASESWTPEGNYRKLMDIYERCK